MRWLRSFEYRRSGKLGETWRTPRQLRGPGSKVQAFGVKELSLSVALKEASGVG